MRGEIEWMSRASNCLAQIWMDATDRHAINETVDRIEAAIHRDPTGAGESRSEDARIIFDLPIGMLYHVDPRTETAVIMALWVVRPGPGRRRD